MTAAAIDYRVLGPIWPRMPRCALCGTIAPAGTHEGQRQGCRRYTCRSCLQTWHEPPKGWHVVWPDGSESVVDALVHDACFPNRDAPSPAGTIPT